MIVEIQEKLRQIETEHGVRILYACESGSRAWGIESVDSDWDVRFVYVHPRSWYLRLHEGRDVIEHPFGHMADNLDFQGFDLRKALRLAAKSNPSVLGWLASPIVYAEHVDVVESLREAMRGFSPAALMHHYTSLAVRQYKAYWSEGEPVRFKKYLYAIRPILAVQWMAQNDYAMPPIRLPDLRRDTAMPDDSAAELDRLLEMKATSTEIGGRGRFLALDRWIESGLETSRRRADDAPARKPDMDALQNIFWRAVGEREQ